MTLALNAAAASNLGVFHELARDVPDVLSPIDGEGWLQTVLDYAAPDSPRRAAQLQRMAINRIPNWHDHFAAVQDWLPPCEAWLDIRAHK